MILFKRGNHKNFTFLQSPVLKGYDICRLFFKRHFCFQGRRKNIVNWYSFSRNYLHTSPTHLSLHLSICHDKIVLCPVNPDRRYQQFSTFFILVEEFEIILTTKYNTNMFQMCEDFRYISYVLKHYTKSQTKSVFRRCLFMSIKQFQHMLTERRNDSILETLMEWTTKLEETTKIVCLIFAVKFYTSLTNKL